MFIFFYFPTVNLALRISSSVLVQSVEENVNARAESAGIPKIIHQTWKTTDLPPAFKRWSQSWKDCLPDWEHKLHTDEDNRKLIATHFPDFLPTYDGYKEPIERVDAVRYAYLAVEGGLYIDLDIECLKDPTPVLDQVKALNASVFLVREAPTQVSQAFMGAGFPTRNNVFFENIIRHRLNKFTKGKVLSVTGLLMFTTMLKTWEGLTTKGFAKGSTTVQKGKSGENYLLAHEDLFMPAHFSDKEMIKRCDQPDNCREAFPDAYSFSHWSGTWRTKHTHTKHTHTHTDTK